MFEIVGLYQLSLSYYQYSEMIVEIANY